MELTTAKGQLSDLINKKTDELNTLNLALLMLNQTFTPELAEIAAKTTLIESLTFEKELAEKVAMEKEAELSAVKSSLNVITETPIA